MFHGSAEEASREPKSKFQDSTPKLDVPGKTHKRLLAMEDCDERTGAVAKSNRATINAVKSCYALERNRISIADSAFFEQRLTNRSEK
jgi:hypothetical protein